MTMWCYLADIGAILETRELSPLCGSVSWTNRPVSYFLHHVNRSMVSHRPSLPSQSLVPNITRSSLSFTFTCSSTYSTAHTYSYSLCCIVMFCSVSPSSISWLFEWLRCIWCENSLNYFVHPHETINYNQVAIPNILIDLTWAWRW